MREFNKSWFLENVFFQEFFILYSLLVSYWAW